MTEQQHQNHNHNHKPFGNDQDYVLVLNAGRNGAFVNIKTGEKIAKGSWEDAFPEVPRATIGADRKVSREAYRPDLRIEASINDGIFYDDNGIALLNTYRKPMSNWIYNAWDEPKFQAIKRHLELLFDDTTERQLVWDFMAHQVQNPGSKIRWALVILGPEGSGKTLLVDMLKRALGQSNCKTINNNALDSNFNEWAVGGCLGVVEELYEAGKNRHKVINSLKEVITNATVSTNVRNVGNGEELNFLNLVCLTNHADALPVSDEDRRFCIIQTRHKTKAEVAAGVPEGHFAEFAEAAKDVDLVRSALLQYKVSQSFPKDGPAPQTHAKQEMTNNSLGKVAGALKDMITEEEHDGIWPELFSGKSAMQKLTETLRRNIDGRELKKAATALGFVSVGVCNKDVGFEQSRKHRWYAHKDIGLPEATNLNTKVQWADLEPYAKHPD
tara:strand:- start:528 stop:1853 length:1326 start_codon:yes stop_codon:yes gene_type:complete